MWRPCYSGRYALTSHQDYTWFCTGGHQESNHQELLYRDTKWSHCCVAAWLLWSSTAVRQLVTVEVTGRIQPPHRRRLQRGE
jgi:hypothetical protein